MAVNIKKNYFYDLPNDLQEKIHNINIETFRYDVNYELTTIYNCFKYINTILKEIKERLYHFMDENNVNILINEEIIQENLPILKDNIIENLNLPSECSDFIGFKLKKNILFYLRNKFENELYNYSTDEEIHDDIESNISEETITFEDSMADLLLENFENGYESD
jgi:hypothetical protein